jgi:hypothetical protein
MGASGPRLHQPSLAPREDLVHEPEANPIWRESYHFGFGDPASGRFGYATFGKRPHKSSTGYLIALWDPAEGFLVGQRATRFETHDDHHDIAGLRAACVTPFEEWTVSFDGDLVRVPRTGRRRYEEARAVPDDPATRVPVSFDFTWSALTPPHAYTWAPVWGALFHGRHEQPGRCDGTLAVGGHTTALDGWSGLRDHAWGARDWFGTTGWRWISATFDTAPHLSLLYAQLDDGTTVVDGAIYDEDRAARIVSYSETVEEIPAEGKDEPLAATFEVRDETGRTLEVRGTVTAGLPIRFHPRDADGPVSWNDRCVMSFEAAHGAGIGEMEFMGLAETGKDPQ